VDAKPFGPVQAYVAPATVLEVRLNAEPAQMGLLELAEGVVGNVFTTTSVVPATLEQPSAVALTLYVPLADAVGLATVGFCSVDAKPFGPVHEYVAPATVLEVRFNALPTQTGVFEPATGVAGMPFTTTLVLPTRLAQPLTVAMTLYGPLAAKVGLAMVGFCSVDAKPLGPVQE